MSDGHDPNHASFNPPTRMARAKAEIAHLESELTTLRTQLATANDETARLGRELEEARAERDKYAGTLPRRFHVLLDGITALGWTHPAPHDSKQAPEQYALEWLASELARIERLRAVLNRHRVTESCNCGNCAALIEGTAEFSCEHCGYKGKPFTLPCACYDRMCSGGTSRGMGCPHGCALCPVCDDGQVDVDPWSIIKEIRAACDTHHDMGK